MLKNLKFLDLNFLGNFYWLEHCTKLVKIKFEREPIQNSWIWHFLDELSKITCQTDVILRSKSYFCFFCTVWKLRIFLPLSRIYVTANLEGYKDLFKMKLISHNFCQLIMTLKFLNFHTVLWPERPNYWLVGLFGPQVPRARAGSNTEISGSGFIGLF